MNLLNSSIGVFVEADQRTLTCGHRGDTHHAFKEWATAGLLAEDGAETPASYEGDDEPSGGVPRGRGYCHACDCSNEKGEHEKGHQQAMGIDRSIRARCDDGGLARTVHANYETAMVVTFATSRATL
jgi:hypothetical protein